MTKKDIDKLEAMRREVTLMQADYGDQDAYGRLQAVLDGLDECLDGPQWRASGSHSNLLGPASAVVRAHSSEQARARAENLGFVVTGVARIAA